MTIEYKGYLIEPSMTMWVKFIFYIPESETIQGHGYSIQDCKEQIDELLDQ